MVRGLYPVASQFADTKSLGPVDRLRRAKEVINTDTFIILPCAALIIPERIVPRTPIELLKGLRQAEIEKRVPCRMGFRAVSSITFPANGVMNVFRFGDNIIVCLLYTSPSPRD